MEFRFLQVFVAQEENTALDFLLLFHQGKSKAQKNYNA